MHVKSWGWKRHQLGIMVLKPEKVKVLFNLLLSYFLMHLLYALGHFEKTDVTMFKSHPHLRSFKADSRVAD